MRGMTFRGKSLKDGNWCIGVPFFTGDERYGKDYYIGNNFLECGEYDCVGCEAVEVYAETIGQYTGLQDKNGTRIFEGDIITVPWSGDKWIVKFCNGQFVGVNEKKLRSNEIIADIIVGSSNGTEVIGNIYDNPEFTEATK